MMNGDDAKKLPGKTKFSGRRRSVTRKSGFHVHPDATGKELQHGRAAAYSLRKGDELSVRFALPEGYPSSFVGYGVWYRADRNVSVRIRGRNLPKNRMLTDPSAPNWSKAGSMWVSTGDASEAEVIFHAAADTSVSLWHPACGVVGHDHLNSARAVLLKNMHRYSPEAHFITVPGDIQVRDGKGRALEPDGEDVIYLKACNRCARFLPVNLINERVPLSFSNHCVAAHLRPCKHATFGRLTNVADGTSTQLEYGFQLECRFCKKFEVNAAHNPQRSAAQMKEDGARRRAFELLLSELYGESAQLRYRHRTGVELADTVHSKFEGACFRCGTRFSGPRDMHLDHTRPLALLWPLDATATALCGGCNSEKRDRPPSEFYSADELDRLSRITGLDIEELCDPSPNLEALNLLAARLDWFFGEFLLKPELTRIRDGKTAAELLVKALQKVIEFAGSGEWPNLLSELSRRRA
jgi:hypothetical protein